MVKLTLISVMPEFHPEFRMHAKRIIVKHANHADFPGVIIMQSTCSVDIPTLLQTPEILEYK